MELSKGQILRNAIDEVKKRTGLDDKAIRQLFVKEYLLEDEGKDSKVKFAEWLRKAAGHKPLK